MTPQEAINNIDDILSSDVNLDKSIDYQLTSYDIDWLEKSKEALGKTIQKKPIIKESRCSFDYVFSYCPACKKCVGLGVHNCHICGQALDWGD